MNSLPARWLHAEFHQRLRRPLRAANGSPSFIFSSHPAHLPNFPPAAPSAVAARRSPAFPGAPLCHPRLRSPLARPCGTVPEETWGHTEAPAERKQHGAGHGAAAQTGCLAGPAAPSLASTWRAATLARSTRRLTRPPSPPVSPVPGPASPASPGQAAGWPPRAATVTDGWRRTLAEDDHETLGKPAPSSAPGWDPSPSLPHPFPATCPRASVPGLATLIHTARLFLSPSSCLSPGPPTEARPGLSRLLPGCPPRAPPTQNPLWFWERWHFQASHVLALLPGTPFPVSAASTYSGFISTYSVQAGFISTYSVSGTILGTWGPTVSKTGMCSVGSNSTSPARPPYTNHLPRLS